MTAQMVDICLVLALDVLPKLEEEAKGRMLAGKHKQIIAEAGQAREKAAKLTAPWGYLHLPHPWGYSQNG